MVVRFNPPPNWPTPPPGWTPPAGWRPDPSWGDPPEGWELWTDEEIHPLYLSGPRGYPAHANRVRVPCSGLGRVVSVVGAVGFTLGVIVVLGSLFGVTDRPLDPGGTAVPASPHHGGAGTASASRTPARDSARPTPSNFAVMVKILAEECAGENGCFVRFRINLAYQGPDLDPEKTYAISYAVSGPEGPVEGTIAFMDGAHSRGYEESVTTPRPDTRIEVQVTGVEET